MPLYLHTAWGDSDLRDPGKVEGGEQPRRFPMLDGVFPAPNAHEVTAHDAGSWDYGPLEATQGGCAPASVSHQLSQLVLLTPMGRGSGARAIGGWP